MTINDTMSVDDEVASDLPQRYLLFTFDRLEQLVFIEINKRRGQMKLLMGKRRSKYSKCLLLLPNMRNGFCRRRAWSQTRSRDKSKKSSSWSKPSWEALTGAKHKKKRLLTGVDQTMIGEKERAGRRILETHKKSRLTKKGTKRPKKENLSSMCLLRLR